LLPAFLFVFTLQASQTMMYATAANHDPLGHTPGTDLVSDITRLDWLNQQYEAGCAKIVLG
jgi:hypothetical protein